jgi:hypothetical protein
MTKHKRSVKDYNFLDDAHEKLDFPKYICLWEKEKPLTAKTCKFYKDNFCTNEHFCNQKVKVKMDYDFIDGKWVPKSIVKKLLLCESCLRLWVFGISDLKIEVIK